ncbi:MAG TPA: hypothetical protein VIT23_17675 [Terrimicrobiaceae bacterium]
MILYDILHNARRVKLEDISGRQGAFAAVDRGDDFDFLNPNSDKNAGLEAVAGER